MIKERYIREWNEFVPWKDMLMVEQDYALVYEKLIDLMPGKRD